MSKPKFTMDPIYKRTIYNTFWTNAFIKRLPNINMEAKTNQEAHIAELARDKRYPTIQKEFAKKSWQAECKKHLSHDLRDNNHLITAIKQAKRKKYDAVRITIIVERLTNYLHHVGDINPNSIEEATTYTGVR
jgi:hypothetical protein